MQFERGGPSAKGATWIETLYAPRGWSVEVLLPRGRAVWGGSMLLPRNFKIYLQNRTLWCTVAHLGLLKTRWLVLGWKTRDELDCNQKSVVKVVMWSRGAHLTKPGWSKPQYPIPHPTNLALFGHNTTLYRFNQGVILLQGAQIGAGGWAPPGPPHFNHCRKWRLHQYGATWPKLDGPVAQLCPGFQRPYTSIGLCVVVVAGILCPWCGQHQREDPVFRRQSRGVATAPGRRKRSRGDGDRAAGSVQSRRDAEGLRWKQRPPLGRTPALSSVQNARPRLLLCHGKGRLISFFSLHTGYTQNRPARSVSFGYLQDNGNQELTNGNYYIFLEVKWRFA